MSQNEPDWQFCLFDKNGQVLSDQNDGTKGKISVLTGPKRTNKRTKSAAREEEFKIVLMVRRKKNNTVYKTKSDLNIFSRCLAIEKESRNIEAIPAGELDTYLLHDSWQTKVSKEYPKGQ